MSRAITKASGGFPVGASSLLASHSDSTLLGFYLVASGGVAPAVLKSAVDALKSLSTNVDSSSLNIARRLAALKVLRRSENSASLTFDSAAQLLAATAPASISDVIRFVGEVTADDIKMVCADT